MIQLISTFEWVLATSVKTLPLILLVFLLQRYGKKLASASNIHLLWLLVLVCLSLPLGWQFSPAISDLPQQSLQMNSTQTKVALSAPDPAPKPGGELLTNSTGTVGDNSTEFTLKEFSNLPLLVSLVWLSGAGFLLLAIVWQSLRYMRFEKKSVVANELLNAQLNALKARMGISRNVQLLISKQIDTPVTFGYWNPVILVPGSVINHLNGNNIEHILLHELTHVKRRDIAFCWVASFITILHWFNPAVWFALNSMRKNMEIACDADALHYLQKAEYAKYGETLITLSDNSHCSQQSKLVVGILENHNDLKERITMIAQTYKSGLKSRLLLVLAATFITLTAIAQPQLSEKDNEANEIGDPNTIKLSVFALQAERDLKTTILVGEQWSNNKIRVSKNSSKLEYGKLLSVLRVNGYTAFRTKDAIQIIDEKLARSSTLPVVTPNGHYLEDEYVTEHIKLDKACAMGLLPVLRPMVPQHSHMGAAYDRSLIITDTYGNIQRIKEVIKEVESSMNKVEECHSEK